MAIHVTCPNGHRLVVQDSGAGKVGLCPACKAQVVIPRPSNGQLSEDEIADFLTAPDTSRKPHGSTPGYRPTEGEGSRAAHNPTPPKKACTKCNREIASGTHICPFCRTYIASLNDL